MKVAPQTLGQIAGVKDLTSLLEFLSDQKKFKAKMDELSAQIKKLETAAERYTKAKDIGRALASAKSSEEQATAVLATAQTQAAKLLDDAGKKAAEAVQRGRKCERDAEEGLAQRESEASQRFKEAAAMMDEAAKESAKAQSMLSKAERMLEQSIRIKDEFTERAARLQAAIGG